MSNYIVVEKGLYKRVIPDKLFNIEFVNSKGITLNNKDVSGIGGRTVTVLLPELEENPLSKLVVVGEPILDGDSWSYEVRFKNESVNQIDIIKIK